MYVRIDKLDGSRQSLTREQLAEGLSKHLSLVEEEISLIDGGATSADDFAWYIRELVPGLRGTAAQNRAQSDAGSEPESHTVHYGGQFHVITPAGMDHFSEFGADVCAGDMTEDEAMYQVLVAEGVEDLPKPDELAPDVVGALCSLVAAADYYARTITGEEFIQLNGDALRKVGEFLEPGLRDKLGRAHIAIGKLRDQAKPTPQLVELRKEREKLLYKRLEVEFTALLLSYDLSMVQDVRFYNREECNQRGVDYGRNTIMTVTFDGSPLHELINGGDDSSYQLHQDIEAILEQFGYRHELNRSWSFSLYEK